MSGKQGGPREDFGIIKKASEQHLLQVPMQSRHHIQVIEPNSGLPSEGGHSMVSLAVWPEDSDVASRNGEPTLTNGTTAHSRMPLQHSNRSTNNGRKHHRRGHNPRHHTRCMSPQRLPSQLAPTDKEIPQLTPVHLNYCRTLGRRIFPLNNQTQIQTQTQTGLMSARTRFEAIKNVPTVVGKDLKYFLLALGIFEPLYLFCSLFFLVYFATSCNSHDPITIVPFVFLNLGVFVCECIAAWKHAEFQTSRLVTSGKATFHRFLNWFDYSFPSSLCILAISFLSLPISAFVIALSGGNPASSLLGRNLAARRCDSLPRSIFVDTLMHSVWVSLLGN